MSKQTLYKIVSWLPDSPGLTIHVECYGFREAKDMRDKLRKDMPERTVNMVRK